MVITVERPNGDVVETVKTMNDAGFGMFLAAAEGNQAIRTKIYDATANAGKGRVRGYEIRDVAVTQPLPSRSPREERAALVANINAILAVQEDKRASWFDNEAPGGGMPVYDTPEYTRAEAALAAFDAAHPEVAEELKREKAEMVKRHMWD